MAAVAPLLVDQQASTYNSWSATKQVTVAVEAGDVIVVSAQCEGNQSNGEDFSCADDNSPSSNTYTQQQLISVTGFNTAAAFTAVAAATDATLTITVTAVNIGTGLWWGFNARVFRGSDGVGTSNKENGTDGGSGTEPALTLTGVAANSAIVMTNGDWNAVDGASRTYREADAGTFTESLYFRDASRYTVYGGSYLNAGSAATKVIGLSVPTGQKYAIIGVEVLGTDAVQLAYPSTDTTRTNWEENDGTTDDLKGRIDEVTPDDADFIRTGLSPSSAIYVTKFGALSDPVSSAGHQVSLRYGKSAAGGESIGLLAQLRQGYTNEGSPGTLIATVLNNTDFSEGWTQTDYTLSGAEADSITNYADLYLRLVGNKTGDPVVAAPQVGALATIASTSLTTLAWPAGYTPVAGDFAMIFSLARGASATVSNSDTGNWSQLTQVNNGTGLRTRISYRVLQGSDTLPNITASVSGLIAAYVVVWSGVDGTTPFDMTEATGTGTNTTMTAPTATTVTNNAMVIRSFMSGDDNEHGSNSEGTLGAGGNNYDTTTGADGAHSFSYVTKASAGATGTATMSQTLNGADVYVAYTLALRPASGTRRAQVSWARLRTPEAGSPTYNDSVSETATASDSVSASGLNALAAVAETGTATDSPSAVFVAPAAVAETGSATDSLSAALVAPASVLEAGGGDPVFEGLSNTHRNINSATGGSVTFSTVNAGDLVLVEVFREHYPDITGVTLTTPPALTGTPTQITWASGADPAAQNITIPADATAVYAFWSYWRDAVGDGLASITLNSVAPDQTFETPTTNSQTASGVAVWYNPSTGTRSLDVAWDGAPAEGATCVVAYVKGGNTTAWRDADANAASSTDPVTVTLTTASGDLVLKYDQRFDAGGTPPSTSAGWNSAQTHANNGEVARLSYISATGTTQVCDSEDESFSSVVAISIPATSGQVMTEIKRLDLDMGAGQGAGVWACIANAGGTNVTATSAFSTSAPFLQMAGARWSGVSSATPLQSACNVAACDARSGPATDVTLLSITTSVRALIVAMGSDWSDFYTHTAQGNWAKRLDNAIAGGGSTTTMWCFDQVANAGTFGGGSDVISTRTSDYWAGAIFSFAPEGGSAATDEVSALKSFTGVIAEAGAAADTPDASGLNALASVAETGTAGDTLSAIFTGVGAVAETGTATEAVSGGVSFGADVAETAAATDEVSALKVFTGEIAETGTATDASSAALTTAADVTSVAAALDVASAAFVANAGVSEAGTAADTVTASHSAVVAVAETANLTDTLTVTTGWGVQISEALTGAEAVDAALTAAVDITEAASAEDLVLGTVGGITGDVLESASAQDAVDATVSSTIASGLVTHGFGAPGSWLITSGFVPVVANEYNVTISEAGAAADTVSATLSVAGVVSEAGTALEATSATLSLSGAVSEAGTALEAVAGSLVVSVSVAEVLGALDAVSALLAVTGSVLEAGTALEATTATATVGGAVSETGTAADAVSGGNLVVAAVDEPLAADVAADAALTAAASVDEPLAADAAASAVLTASSAVSEADTAAEAVSAAATSDAAIAEAGAAADAVSGGNLITAEVSEALSALDSVSVARLLNLDIAEAITAIDAVNTQLDAVGLLLEAGTATDDPASIMEASAQLTEVLDALDQVSGQLDIDVAVAEAGSAADVVRTGNVFADSITEAGNAQDTLDSFLGVLPSLTTPDVGGEAGWWWNDLPIPQPARQNVQEEEEELLLLITFLLASGVLDDHQDLYH